LQELSTGTHETAVLDGGDFCGIRRNPTWSIKLVEEGGRLLTRWPFIDEEIIPFIEEEAVC
jgi:hypothetical protein